MQHTNPLIVQSDKTLLLDVHAPLAEVCRDALIPFAELKSSPEHLHTYSLSPLSLWNATSAGFTAEDVTAVLKQYSRFEIPQSVLVWVQETASRFGKLRLIPDDNTPHNEEDSEKAKSTTLLLVCEDLLIYKEICSNNKLTKYLSPLPENTLKNGVYGFRLLLIDRGIIKQELITQYWPVKDEVPLRDGEKLEIHLKDTTTSGVPLVLREYQKEATKSFLGDGGPGTGYGTIVLPCGAGKTVVGMSLMAKLQMNTLILTTNISAVHQWKNELLDKTDLEESKIGEYTGENKNIQPVTVATYQILTWRPEKEGPFPHFHVFNERNWGLIIYDEVHLLPAPVFRITAEIQAIRRVGLTATLVREDGFEKHVFSLVGPKRYDVPWKELEKSGWIAQSECIELRLDMSNETQISYATATMRQKHRIACENPAKIPAVMSLVNKFTDDKILIIGQYLTQLCELAEILKAPIITGKTPNAQRDAIYDSFRKGEIKLLIVSKVANFAIDLPDASMAIQISGTFGSRQEEAQRLGRILRPKKKVARFITIITRNTEEDIFGANRQKFLAEQGYSYKMVTSVDEISDIPDTEKGNLYDQ